jgi:hypothetical protein
LKFLLQTFQIPQSSNFAIGQNLTAMREKPDTLVRPMQKSAAGANVNKPTIMTTQQKQWRV